MSGTGVPTFPYYTPLTLVGLNQPAAFYCEWASRYVQTLIVWDNGTCINGCKVIHNDTQSWGTFGIESGTLCRLDLQQGEKITSLAMYPTVGNQNVARITFTTTLGQTFIHGTSNTGFGTTCPLGSGILSGLTGSGNAGEPLSNLGLFFLMPLASVAIALTYDSDPTSGNANTGITSTILSQAKRTNPGANPTTYDFQGTATRMNSSEYTVAVAEHYGVSTTVTGPSFSIRPGSTSTWQKTAITTMAPSNSTEVELSWDSPGNLPPGMSIACTSNCSQGILNLTFTCTVSLTFEDSTIDSVAFSSSGVAEITCYGNVTTSVRPVRPRIQVGACAEWVYPTRK